MIITSTIKYLDVFLFLLVCCLFCCCVFVCFLLVLFYPPPPFPAPPLLFIFIFVLFLSKQSRATHSLWVANTLRLPSQSLLTLPQAVWLEQQAHADRFRQPSASRALPVRAPTISVSGTNQRVGLYCCSKHVLARDLVEDLRIFELRGENRDEVWIKVVNEMEKKKKKKFYIYIMRKGNDVYDTK